ncbi:MAG: STAS domain-containing protein [Rhodospirillales bacterium]|nr:STAS domain-containing protein [Rhodospirillales bacterium]
MKTFTRIENGVFVAEFTGKLDTSTSGDAYDKMVNIAKECGSKLVLNLEKLEYMSRAGLSILLMTSKLLQASSRQMKICNPNDSVKEVLEFSEFNSLLHVYDNETDAIAAF